MGTYKLKGVTGEQVVMQINSHTFAERVFPKKAASNKAELVRPPPPPPPLSLIK
jgi:hypothetical protein